LRYAVKKLFRLLYLSGREKYVFVRNFLLTNGLQSINMPQGTRNRKERGFFVKHFVSSSDYFIRDFINYKREKLREHGNGK